MTFAVTFMGGEKKEKINQKRLHTFVIGSMTKNSAFLEMYALTST